MLSSTCLVALASFSSVFALPTDNVKTPHGSISGFVDGSYAPNVKQYLGIPFAKPPVGSLRFESPVPATVSGNFDATKRQPSCSQSFSKLPSIFDLTPEFVPPGPFSEDCLYLNVFTPKTPKAKGEALPTVVWVHGGVLDFGGTNVPGEFPMKWVEHTQEHIVVQISYRMNVFGFPNARGLAENKQNPGVEDARLALEWVRDNIKYFGGDSDRIILQGQAAGAALADILEYAYPHDPIAKGVIHESAVASALNGTASDPHHEHAVFTALAKHLGCDTSSANEELRCMRNMDQERIETFLQKYTDAGTMPPIAFSPIADGNLVFTPEQYLKKFAQSKLPAIIGFNAQEGASFVPYTSPANPGATKALVKDFTLWELQCVTLNATRQRYEGGALTYGYIYSGNFTNVSPEPWMGSYHFSELPLVFGTHEDLSPKSTKYEFDVSHAFQKLWLAFAKDPVNGPKKMGWPLYAPEGHIMHFAPHGSKSATKLSLAKHTDMECF